MNPLISFVLDGNGLDTNELTSIKDTFPKTGNELVLFFDNLPKQSVLDILNDCENIKYCWPKYPGVEPYKKALICATGKWVVFTTFNNFIRKGKSISQEVTHKNSGLVICRFNQNLPGFLKLIGVRDITLTPYIAADKRFANLNLSYDEAQYNFEELVKKADKRVGVAFVFAKEDIGESVFNHRVRFFRPYLKIILRFFKRATLWFLRKSRWFLRKSRSFPKYLAIKVGERIRIARTRPIYYSPKIPVFIITRDRVAPLRKLVKWIEQEGLTNIIFLDNDSTYPPLLKYFSEAPYEVVRLPNNTGHKAPWSENVIQTYASGQPFMVTDPDVIPDSETHGAVKEFVRLLNKYRRYVKVGLALHIDDLPDSFELKQSVIVWESQFWKKEIEKDVYDAPTDTTFALYRPGTPHIIEPALRTGKFQARHEPWYVDSNNPGAEVSYYREHADKVVGSWGLKKGDLSPFYINYEDSQDK